jgi:hypothetical protein
LGSLFNAVLLSTVLAVGAELGSDQNDGDIVRACAVVRATR